MHPLKVARYASALARESAATVGAMGIVTEADSRVPLPARYQTPWREPYEAAIAVRLKPDNSVLDIGSGRNPSIDKEMRPSGVTYVGLDLSAGELAAADPGAYDEAVVSDITQPVPDLQGRFDLAVSWQVLEHVRPLDHAIENIATYLRPGGTLVALFSGTWSAFGVANKLIPDRVGSELVGRVMRRKNSDRPVFPAHYDRCYDSALRRLFADWGAVRIEPYFRGATYFHFAPPLQRLYLAYENLISRRPMPNLATHYLVVATR